MVKFQHIKDVTVERFTDDFINAVTDSYRLAVEERKSREARMAVQAEEYTPTLA